MAKMSNQKLYDITTQQLKSLGFKEKRVGFSYLRTVIMIYAKEPRKNHNLYEILDYVAEDMGYKGDSIRPSCRDSLQEAFRDTCDAFSAFNKKWAGDTPPILPDFCSCVANRVVKLYKEVKT